MEDFADATRDLALSTVIVLVFARSVWHRDGTPLSVSVSADSVDLFKLTIHYVGNL